MYTYVLYYIYLSNWFTDRMAGILGAAYYNRLVRHVLRRERVYRDRQNPFDRYDDWDFKRRFRFSKGTENILIDF